MNAHFEQLPQNSMDFDETWYPLVFFLVADYESELKITKFKMADSIWQTKMQKVPWFEWKSVLRGFLGRWLRIRGHQFRS